MSAASVSACGVSAGFRSGEAAMSAREVWLDIPGYEGVYEASNLGRIRRVSTGRILRASPCKGGYPAVTLSKDNEQQSIKVCVAVLRAFCGPAPFAGADCAHNDGDPANSNLTNLRWATKVENQADVDRHGRRCRGERVFGAKLTEPRVREIRQRIAAGERNPPIADDFGVSISTIHLIRHNRIWSHV